MLWWFEKTGKHLVIEVLQLSTGGYDLQFVDEDGVEHVEHFAESSDLADRQRELEASLKARGWSRAGGWVV